MHVTVRPFARRGQTESRKQMAIRKNTPIRNIADPKQVSEWDRVLKEATDHEISVLLTRKWSVWRWDMLRGAAHDRGLL